MLVGRDCDGLLLSDPRVSRTHAEFSVVDDRLFVDDLESTNGTTRNGTLVRSAEPVRPGDEIVVGDTHIEVVAIDSTLQPGSAGQQRANQANEANDSAREPNEEDLAPTALHQVLVAGDTPEPVPDRSTTELTPATAMPSALSEVAKRLPELSLELTAHGPDGTVTILAAELAGASQHRATMGTARWLRYHDEWEAISRAVAEAAGGRELYRHHDAMLLAFPNPRRGLRWAMQVNRHLENLDIGATPIAARTGLHLASYEPSEARSLADTASVAVSVAMAAGRSEVLATPPVRDIAVGRDGLRFGATRLVSDGVGSLLEVAAADSIFAAALLLA